MPFYLQVQQQLVASPKTWLVTGAAGFIGSHLTEKLLALGQTVVGLDDFSIGNPANLNMVRQAVGEVAWQRFRMVEGSIIDSRVCAEAVRDCDYVLHQAALSSVRRSIQNPGETHRSNVSGFLNMLMAARDSGVRRFVYASTAAVYGNDPNLPKQEADLGNLLSPYAVTKRINEIYAENFFRVYGTPVVGLRYFNVFGPRQNPQNAVIPRWIHSLLNDEAIHINGSGEISRDFTYVANIVQLNILAAVVDEPRALGQVFNGATGKPCNLHELFRLLKEQLAPFNPQVATALPIYNGFSDGDIFHSCGDITKAHAWLGYVPTDTLESGLRHTVRTHSLNWERLARKPATFPLAPGIIALS